ncbi:hypothetical protein H0O03_04925 [Candidatus Micrarchaeota archaeon]|nr:hypothetical protein [Candidatus Micrarchaeota archaeon]
MKCPKMLLLFAAVALLAGAVNALTLQNYSFSPATLKPGTSGSMNLVLQNAGAEYVSGATLTASGTGLAFTGSIYVGDLGSAGTTNLAVPFVVKQDAKAGSYAASITIGYVSTAYATASGASRYVTLSVPYTISTTTGIEVSTAEISPQTVSPGDRFLLTVNFRNTGGSIYNAVITASDSFSLDGVSRIEVGDIAVGESVEKTIPLIASTSLSTGLQSAALTLTYDDVTGAESTEQLLLGPVPISEKTPAIIVGISATDTNPGSRTQVVTSVTNAGTTALENVRISLQPASFFVPLEYAEKSVGRLDVGETKDLLFAIGISPAAAPQYYSVSFNVSYDGGRGTETETKALGLEVRGKTELSASASTNPTPITTNGGSYSLSVQVSNLGDATVRALSVSIESPLIRATDTDYNYIGNLDVDDYSTAQFAIITKQGLTPGNYPLNVTLRYKDAFNTPHEENHNLQLSVFSPDIATLSAKGGDNTGWLVAILVILAVGGYAVYVKVLRKKKHATL